MATPAICPQEFETVIEAEADGRGRLPLGRAGAKPGRRYRVDSNADGVLLLTPVVSIPEREMAVWENPALADSIRQSIAETEQGDTVDLGSFSEYLEDEDED